MTRGASMAVEFRTNLTARMQHNQDLPWPLVSGFWCMRHPPFMNISCIGDKLSR